MLPNLQPGPIFSIGTTIRRILQMPGSMVSSTIWRVKSTLGISRVNPPIPHAKVHTPQMTVETPPVAQAKPRPKKPVARVKAETKATFSQIHLVNQRTQKRTVVHIGSTVGRAETEILLDQGSHKP